MNIPSKVFMKVLSIEEFVPESRNLLQEYICNLCKGIYLNPVSDECGHIFCDECLKKSFEIIDICPISKTQIKKTEIIEAKYIKSIIEKQPVYCQNQSLGCEWKGKLSQRSLHQHNECQRRIIYCEECKENGIEFKGYPEEIFEHDENHCDFKMVSCINKCGYSFKRFEKEKHLIECPKETIYCRMSCEHKIKREDADYHLNTLCPKHMINCNFYEYGCYLLFPREMLCEHNKENKFNHNRMFLRNVKNINEYESFFEKINSLEYKLIEKNELIENKYKEILKIEEKKDEVQDKFPDETQKIEDMIEEKNNIQHFPFETNEEIKNQPSENVDSQNYQIYPTNHKTELISITDLDIVNFCKENKIIQDNEEKEEEKNKNLSDEKNLFENLLTTKKIIEQNNSLDFYSLDNNENIQGLSNKNDSFSEYYKNKENEKMHIEDKIHQNDFISNNISNNQKINFNNKNENIIKNFSEQIQDKTNREFLNLVLEEKKLKKSNNNQAIETITKQDIIYSKNFKNDILANKINNESLRKGINSLNYRINVGDLFTKKLKHSNNLISKLISNLPYKYNSPNLLKKKKKQSNLEIISIENYGEKKISDINYNDDLKTSEFSLHDDKKLEEKKNEVSIQKIKNVLKKRENEKKIVKDFLQSYVINISNKETNEHSENSNTHSSRCEENLLINEEQNNSTKKFEKQLNEIVIYENKNDFNLELNEEENKHSECSIVIEKMSDNINEIERNDNKNYENYNYGSNKKASEQFSPLNINECLQDENLKNKIISDEHEISSKPKKSSGQKIDNYVKRIDRTGKNSNITPEKIEVINLLQKEMNINKIPIKMINKNSYKFNELIANLCHLDSSKSKNYKPSFINLNDEENNKNDEKNVLNTINLLKKKEFINIENENNLDYSLDITISDVEKEKFSENKELKNILIKKFDDDNVAVYNKENILDIENKFIIDKINISKGLKIIDNRKIQVKNIHKNEHQIVMIDYNLQPMKKSFKWKINLIKIFGWIGIGMCWKEKILENEFKFIHVKNINDHGTYLFSLNGFRWNTSYIQEDNVRSVYFPKIEDNSEIILEYDPNNKTLTFMIDNFESKISNIEIKENIALVPCAVMINDDTEIEFNLFD